MSCRHLVLNTIARQYNERWCFPDYDRAVKKLQCHHVHSFLSCNPQNVEGIIYEYEVPVYICKFSPTKIYSNYLAVANENGTVCIENTSKTKLRTYVQTHNNTVFDLAWMPGEKQFVTVSGDHSAKLWDCGESDIRMVSEFLGHSRSVKCVYFKPENTSVFATGSRDGSLIIWDARCSRKCSKFPVTHIPDQVIPSAAGTSPYVPKRKYYPFEASQLNSVTGLIFQNDNTLISSGSFDQCIRVWDMRKTYSRSASVPLPKYQLCSPSRGFSHICIDPAGNRIYANSMDSYIYCFNANSYHPDPISAFYGHQNGSFYIKSSLSHDGWYLLSGSTDKYAYIWNTRKAELSDVAIKPIVSLPGHTAEVACIAMSLDGGMKVATCSDDGTYRLWFNYNIEKLTDRGGMVDTAEVYSDDYVMTVRTQWRNKRKLTLTDEDNVTATKDFPCTFHTKICRYYSHSLSNISCKCQRHVTSLMKRSHDDENEGDTIAAKRRSLLEMQESTPPKSNEIKTVNRMSIHDVNLQKRSDIVLKTTLKRKLSELPNFVDDVESKRKAQERNLIPIDGLKTKQSINELGAVGVIGDLQGTQLQDDTNNQNGECEEVHDENDCGEYSTKTEFSSPTINLPNYVKDGTSPYIHRCPKTQKLNVDWLTKLRKSSAKKLDVEQVENRESSPKNPKNDGKLQILGLKRKIVRSNSTEAKNQTLHKYFKISSRPAEISYGSQEIHKKSVNS